MTLGEVIDFVDGLRPNAFTNQQKTCWLGDCEGMVQSDVLLLAPEEIITYQYERDLDSPMLVQPPHVRLYRSYLCAMIDFHNGDWDSYQNSREQFQGEFKDFVRWFCNTYRPADTTEEVNGYGVL